ncbi:cytochrome d ubiquinol oxidase subunit II [Aquibacillus koreensis]|uniref:Cytochrome d ubiquinol oxidase subunit II n=1 Tax=Aquibacillus koreensis TaxID=279446 RepID=A0A9X4AJS6_9BACI|nr:cytochrome d ubiquinol oxidase subunit II [Aquibacillus koreensis]MCT2535377.1 cytochrome d ubiquinol oxidase subunit II [Aquibacillus koreensis]MDC3422542.1 cytochrome d ubiquinol oxidase subunit II [Aquibacillus koreensis]
MSYEVIGITVLWLFLYGYVIVASIDFGAGFFAYYAKVTKRDHITNKLISRYLSPVWEVTNVFLVFFFVGIVGFFPSAAYYYGSALLVPASFAIVLIAIRGSFYAFENYGSKQSNVYLFLYGATGLFIPASLSVALTISEGGFITEENGVVSLKYFELFTSPLAWSIVALAVVAILFISASFLTYYASRANDKPALQVVRKWALFWATPTIIMALTTMIALSQRNERHYQNMLDLWWIFSLSMGFFIIAMGLLYIGRNYGTAFIAIMLQFFFAFFGYGMAQYPYLLDPFIHIEQSVTNESMAIALIAAFIGGLLLLIPSLILLMRLFLFDADYAKGKK